MPPHVDPIVVGASDANGSVTTTVFFAYPWEVPDPPLQTTGVPLPDGERLSFHTARRGRSAVVANGSIEPEPLMAARIEAPFHALAERPLRRLRGELH